MVKRGITYENETNEQRFLYGDPKESGAFPVYLIIVALGVAFFSGIRASEPDMRLTGDTYFDESNLMDIKALSTYGVTQDDVDAISKIDGVEHAEGAYSADFMQIVDKKQKVLHVISLQDEMNQVKLSDGQMPQKAGECLADRMQDIRLEIQLNCVPERLMRLQIL